MFQNDEKWRDAEDNFSSIKSAASSQADITVFLYLYVR